MQEAAQAHLGQRPRGAQAPRGLPPERSAVASHTQLEKSLTMKGEN